MTRYLTTDTILKSVADTIRAKGKTTEQLTWPTGYNAAINAISPSATSIDNIGPYSIITINNAAELNAKQVMIDIEPVQDLHGYSNPWVAGDGKNKLDIASLTPVKNENGITFTINSDGSISISGTATAQSQVYFRIPKETAANYAGMILDCFPTYQSGIAAIIEERSAEYTNYAYNSSTSGATISSAIASTTNDSNFIVRIPTGTTISGTFKIYPMIRPASSSSGWEPYSNICPITGWTGAKVTRTGKNLCNVASISDAGWAHPSTPITNILNSLNIGTYTFSFDYTITSVRDVYTSDTAKATTGKLYVFGSSIAFRNNGVEITRSQALSGYSGRTVVTFNITAENKGKFTATYFYGLGRDSATEGAPNGTLGYANITNIQIEPGSTATTYQPYSGQTITIPFGDTVYGGTLDVTNGVLTVDRAMADMGTLDWTYNQQYKFFLAHPPVNRKTGVLNIWSDMFKTVAGSWSGTPLPNAIWGNGTNEMIYVQTPPIDNVTNFLTLVTGHQLVYELATPVTYDLTPQEIALLAGTNNLWADCGDVALDYFNEDFADLIEEIGTVEGGDY